MELIYMKCILVFLIILIAGCSTYTQPADTSKFVAGIKNGNLVYIGEISNESVSQLFEAYESSSTKPTRLFISSSGGDIEAGMLLGLWIRKYNLDVEVGHLCASSCANYVFPAGKTKFLHKDSILIWHGSAWQASWNDNMLSSKDMKAAVSILRTKETEFFSEISVDNLLCTYGHERISFWDQLLQIFGSSLIGFDYSLADLQRFGINNIELVDNEWDWRKYQPNRSAQIKRINVKSNIKFTLRRFQQPQI